MLGVHSYCFSLDVGSLEGSQVSRPAGEGENEIDITGLEAEWVIGTGVVVDAGAETCEPEDGAGTEICWLVVAGSVVFAGTETCKPPSCELALLQRQSDGLATSPALTGLLWM